MKRNKSGKEITKLRAEIEILKTRLRESNVFPSESLKFSELKGTVNRLPQNTRITPLIKTEAVTLPQFSYLKADLTKTFALTLISMFFILSLKFIVLPQQKFISQSINNIFQSAASAFGKIKR